MKKIFTVMLMGLLSLSAMAQVPYFGTTTGKNKSYVYTSTNFTPGENATGTYTTFKHGFTNWLDAVTDVTTASGSVNQGFGIGLNFLTSDHCSIGMQSTANFDLTDNYKYSYQSTGLFFNGQITGNLGYISNTWWTAAKGDHTVDQWWYLSYEIKHFTPLVGLTHSWNNFKESVDLSIGVWYNVKNFNFYAWGGNLTNHAGKPYVTLGFDVTF